MSSRIVNTGLAFGDLLIRHCSSITLKYLIIYCTGKRLFCAKARKNEVHGFGRNSQKNDIIIPDPYFANGKIESTSKPPPIDCLARCRVQENNKHLSSASYPQKSLFFYQTTFCDVASVIWQVSCHFENRKYFLERKQPNLCRILKKFKEYFDDTTDCTLWPMNFFEKNDEPTKRLSHVLFKFSFWHFILVTLDFVLCVNLMIWKIFHWQRQYLWCLNLPCPGFPWFTLLM